MYFLFLDPIKDVTPVTLILSIVHTSNFPNKTEGTLFTHSLFVLYYGYFLVSSEMAPLSSLLLFFTCLNLL